MKTKFNTRYWSKPINMNKNLREFHKGRDLGPKKYICQSSYENKYNFDQNSARSSEYNVNSSRILPGTVSINGNLRNFLPGPVCK